MVGHVIGWLIGEWTLKIYLCILQINVTPTFLSCSPIIPIYPTSPALMRREKQIYIWLLIPVPSPKFNSLFSPIDKKKSSCHWLKNLKYMPLFIPVSIPLIRSSLHPLYCQVPLLIHGSFVQWLDYICSWHVNFHASL